MGRGISEPRIFTEIARSKKGGPVFVIGGPREARLTIHSQQCRAINLVCALNERDPRLRERRIAVVGAGAAGLTAASALRALGVPRESLTIYERTASPLNTQRWSYGRFIHPRLFHWPEEGWDNEGANLPVADWKAGYAAEVREQILAKCAALPIQFCTVVSDVEASDGAAEVTYRHLHFASNRRASFDLVLIATGFPVERKIEGTLGGTYWQALEGLDELHGDIHVVGDGDGALTEILMMLIDRFGHAAIEQLCRWLPRTDLERLHTRDLEAQGDPSSTANLSQEEIRSPLIATLFDLLARSRRRKVTVHSPTPLSGASFLLNRALVTHLTWGREPLVSLQGGATIDQRQVAALGGSVIWRAGVGGAPAAEFSQARVATKDLLSSLKPSGKIGGIEVGLLVGLLDAMRRPLWSPTADNELRFGLLASDLGWAEPEVDALEKVAARPSRLADQLLAILAATAEGLAAIGIEELEVLHLDGGRWVGIDLLARAGECPPEDLLEDPPRLRLDAEAAEPQDGSPSLRSVVRRDAWNRLWFQLSDEPTEARPSRGAVRSLVPRATLLAWTERSRHDGDRKPSPRGDAPTELLRGLDDVAAGHHRASLQLAAMYEARGDWEATKRAYLRAARQPGGERMGSSDSPDVNVAFRRVLLQLAGSVARIGPGGRPAVDHAVWLMLAAAAADLVTLVGRKALLLELNTTPSYLREVWAPRVRSILSLSRRIDRGAAPDWASRLADVAVELREPVRLSDDPRDLDRLRSLAGEVVRYAEEVTPTEPLISLSELGVWLSGSPTDHELREALEAAG
jgi:hypothetical protein